MLVVHSEQRELKEELLPEPRTDFVLKESSDRPAAAGTIGNEYRTPSGGF